MTDRRIRIFDTTLRDGEQSPGATMSLEEKLEVAAALADLGVDIIEAGFPIASPGDLAAVRTIAAAAAGTSADRKELVALIDRAITLRGRTARVP